MCTVDPLSPMALRKNRTVQTLGLQGNMPVGCTVAHGVLLSCLIGPVLSKLLTLRATHVSREQGVRDTGIQCSAKQVCESAGHKAQT